MQETWAYAAKGRHVRAAVCGGLGTERSGEVHLKRPRRLPNLLLNAVFALGTMISVLGLAVPAVPGLMGFKVMVVISGSMEPASL